MPSMIVIMFLVFVLILLFIGRLAEVLHARLRDPNALPAPSRQGFDARARPAAGRPRPEVAPATR